MEIVGVLAIWLLFVTLNPIGIGDIVIGENGYILAYIMLCSMSIGRLGLWAFDLAVNQLMQTKNDDSVRAQVNGTQMAFCNIFRMVSSVLTLAFHKVDQFFIVIWVTLAFLLGACIVYTLWFILPWRHKKKSDAKQELEEV